MDRKTQFGIDFLFLASEISKVNLINSKDGSDPLAFFVAKLFLLDFDFSHQDIDLTLKAYNDSHVATISKQPQNVQEKDAEIRLSRIYSLSLIHILTGMIACARSLTETTDTSRFSFT